MFSVDVLPVNRTDFPRNMGYLEERIYRYAFENAMVSSLEFTTFSELTGEVVTEELFKNQWKLRHRVFQAKTSGLSTYDFGKLYYTRIPLTVSVSAALVGPRLTVVGFTQAAPRADSETRQTTLAALAAIRKTVSFAEPAHFW